MIWKLLKNTELNHAILKTKTEMTYNSHTGHTQQNNYLQS